MIATLFFLLGQQPPPPPSPPKPPPPPWRRGVGQCATEPCNGGNAGCSGNLCLGDGDCDADEDCVAGLLCGVDNCAAFRNSDGWPMDEEVWDQTDDCCYSPGGLGSPNPLTATFKTCDVEDAQTNGLTLLHSAPGVFFGDQTRGVRRTQVLSQSDLGIDAPIRAVSLTALTSDGWCVENITANGDLLDGLYGVWLDNPVQDGNYNRYPAFTTYTWRVPNPSNVIEFSWSTCDVSNGQTHGTLLLHLSEVRLMDSQTRNQVTTFQVPAETRALSLTATTSDGWCVEDLKLNGEAPNPAGQPQGMWLDTPPGGYYQPYQVAQTYTWTWAHVNPRPPIGDRCSYTAGDGTGGTEAKIGSYSSADACARAVADGYPQANGATYSATPGNGACYAEYGMTEHNDNPAWVTCLFGGFAPYAPPTPPPIACHQACNGGNNGCGGNLGLGDGDCDNDADCAQGLVCGTDNCMLFRTSAGWPNDGPGWDMTDDCCYFDGGLASSPSPPSPPSPPPMILASLCEVVGSRSLHTDAAGGGVDGGWVAGASLISIVFGAAGGFVGAVLYARRRGGGGLGLSRLRGGRARTTFAGPRINENPTQPLGSADSAAYVPPLSSPAAL